jgi:hypothetical protein
MGLPGRCFHDLGQGRTLGPADQIQYPRAFAFGAGCAGVLRAGGFGSLLARVGILLRRGLGFTTLGGFLPLGAPFFWLEPFFEEAVSGATVTPCSATAATASMLLASAFVMVVNPFMRFTHDDSSLQHPGKARQKVAAPARIRRRRTAGDGPGSPRSLRMEVEAMSASRAL